MLKDKIANILKGTDITLTSVNPEKEVMISESVEDVNDDSLLFLTRTSQGQMRNLDGLDKKKPYAIVCDSECAVRLEGQRILLTNDTRRSLAFAYSNINKINYNKIKIIAVTGTSGKTSTATMIHHILRHNGKNAGLIGTGIIQINEQVVSEDYYSMTTPDPRVLYRAIKGMELLGCEYVVMEASSHAIKLMKLAPITFEVAVFTNLSNEHLDLHGDIEDYYRTKLSLFDKARKGIFNLDCPYSRRAYSEVKCEKASIGIVRQGEVYATDIQERGLFGTYFYYRENGLIFGVDLKPPGAFNVYNALMAIRTAITLGISPCLAKRAINCLEGIEGRMESIRGEVNIVIDYAHTNDAMENVLKFLNSAKGLRQKLIVVFGLGGERYKDKRAELGKIASLYSDIIILTQDNSRSESTEKIIADIRDGIDADKTVEIIPDREEAIMHAVLSATSGDTVAILGKGREKYIIDSVGYRRFSDKETAKRALTERRLRYADKA